MSLGPCERRPETAVSRRPLREKASEDASPSGCELRASEYLGKVSGSKSVPRADERFQSQVANGRAEVLDDYFDETDIVKEAVDEATDWARIEDLPRLWSRLLKDA